LPRVHCEELLWLHEKDKVVVHKSSSALNQLPVTTFDAVMLQVVDCTALCKGA
jgi:hypothetical protein